MSTQRSPLVFRMLLVGAAATLLASGAAAQYIPVQDLDFNGVLDGGQPLKLRGTVVAGTGFLGNASVPVIWDASGSHVLPMLPNNTYGIAYDANQHGIAVGMNVEYIDHGSFIERITTPVVWFNGALVKLDSLVVGGDPVILTEAVAIDAQDRIAGYGFVNSTLRAFLLDHGIVHDLGGFKPIWNSMAAAMDDHGRVVGFAENGRDHAVLWDSGAIIDLHDPSQIAGPTSHALDIDGTGRICGSADFVNSPQGNETAALWDHGRVINLGTLGTGTQSRAEGLNDFGDVVGTSTTNDYLGGAAFLWRDGAMTDLNTLIDPASGWYLGIAEDIDNQGRIVGIGQLAGAGGQPFLMVPDCRGRYAVYGTGCAGENGVPLLLAEGCPSADRDFALSLARGPQHGLGLLFLGTGTGTIPITPACDLQVLPLLPPIVSIPLDQFGELFLATHLPAGFPSFDLNAQMVFLDAAAPFGVSSARPLALHFE